jgi:hypothetical protein
MDMMLRARYMNIRVQSARVVALPWTAPMTFAKGSRSLASLCSA